ncbi:MAG: small multi-drug export protein [Oscillospiraceae bacterium]|nr:small multi-drug export protein [Oscillospiraceae bacterium]
MQEALIEWFTTNLSWLPREAVAFIISMVPILELRGGLIAAALLDIAYIKAVIICIIGNIIPIPFILLLINKIFEFMKKHNILKNLVLKLEEKAMGKSDTIKKYEFVGLMLFVGIPLPGTGGWTGALIAALMGIKMKKSVPAIFLGLIMATIIMSIITYLIPWIIATV